MEGQIKADKNYDTPQAYNSILIGSTVMVHSEDGGLWTHRTIIDKGDHNHYDQSYKMEMVIVKNT